MSADVDLTKISVLAVDDVEDNLDLLEDMLHDAVWSFLRARSGEEAVRLATDRKPDVMLLDLMMPGMNGLCVIRAFRNIGALRETPIIVQTAYANRDAVLAARRLGCHYVLTKPLSRDRLLVEIRHCLKDRLQSLSKRTRPGQPHAAMLDTLTRTLQDGQGLLKADDIAQDAGQMDATDCLRNLIAPDSAIGQKLIRVANSTAYPARYPARNVSEAIVRIGIRETKELVCKSTAASTCGQDSARLLKALERIESLALLFPDRTATREGMLALLNELNRPSETAVPEGRPVADRTQASRRPTPSVEPA